MKKLRLILLWLVPLLRFFALGKKVIFVEGRLYLTRYYLTPRNGWLGRFWRSRWRDYYLHHIHSPDGVRDVHNHPYCESVSTILRGSYHEEREHSPMHVEWITYSPGDVNRLTPEVFHRIVGISIRYLKDAPAESTVWTLFRASARHGQGWGFKDLDGNYRAVDFG